MIVKGTAHCFGDDINTDYVAPGRYKSRCSSFEEYATHIMEDIRPGFYDTLKPGDIIVAGSNFGCGSSRETAPLLLKKANISVVLAKSFARIFFRNAISIGLPVMECDTAEIEDGDIIEVDITGGVVHTKKGDFKAVPLPQGLLDVLVNGGMSENFKKYGTFKID